MIRQPQTIRLPHNWKPRDYQRPLWDFMEKDGRRAAVCWHRRSGKDVLSMNLTACKAMQRPGVYFHCAPEARHARKIAWDNIDSQGRRMIDQCFPKEIRESTNENEMRIKLASGSIWQVVGSDNVDALVGTNPVGIVFSEYAIGNPRSWDLLRPILAENGGWGLFISTPRGQNHFYEMFSQAEKSEDWFSQLLTVDDTRCITPEAIEMERRDGMAESLVQQEFFCSFTSAIAGAYYSELLETAKKEGRIGNVGYDPGLRVHTAWDLGIDDQTSIWFFQRHRQEIRIIDFYENSGAGLAHYTKILDQKPYVYADHFLPHDVKVRELSSGRSRQQMLGSLGLTVQIVPNMEVADGIEAVRAILGRCHFDETKCAAGLKALRSYHTEWNDATGSFRAKPAHDWSSHASDAFRMLALSIEKVDRRARNQHNVVWAETSAGRYIV